MWQTIKAFVTGLFYNVEKLMKDHILEGEILVEKTKRKINGIKDSLNDLMKQTRIMEKTIAEEKDNAKRCEELATSALKSKNESDAKICIQKKLNSLSTIKTLEEEIEKNKKVELFLQESIRTLEDKALKTEQEIKRLQTKIQCAKVRSSIANTSVSYDANSVENILKEIKELHKDKESEAEVLEELGKQNVDNIEAKYDKEKFVNEIDEELKSMKSKLGL